MSPPHTKTLWEYVRIIQNNHQKELSYAASVCNDTGAGSLAEQFSHQLHTSSNSIHHPCLQAGQSGHTCVVDIFTLVGGCVHFMRTSSLICHITFFSYNCYPPGVWWLLNMYFYRSRIASQSNTSSSNKKQENTLRQTNYNYKLSIGFNLPPNQPGACKSAEKQSPKLKLLQRPHQGQSTSNLLSISCCIRLIRLEMRGWGLQCACFIH